MSDELNSYKKFVAAEGGFSDTEDEGTEQNRTEQNRTEDSVGEAEPQEEEKKFNKKEFIENLESGIDRVGRNMLRFLDELKDYGIDIRKKLGNFGYKMNDLRQVSRDQTLDPLLIRISETFRRTSNFDQIEDNISRVSVSFNSIIEGVSLLKRRTELDEGVLLLEGKKAMSEMRKVYDQYLSEVSWMINYSKDVLAVMDDHKNQDIRSAAQFYSEYTKADWRQGSVGTYNMEFTRLQSGLQEDYDNLDKKTRRIKDNIDEEIRSLVEGLNA